MEPVKISLAKIEKIVEKYIKENKQLVRESISEDAAMTILRQLGGHNRLKAMTGARHLLHGMISENNPFLSFKFKRSNGVNYVKIILRNDLYDLEFGHVYGTGYTVKKEYEGVGVENLKSIFTSTTGITTICEYLNENVNMDLSEFLSDKKFINPKRKQFLYHGTSISPEKFNLRDDYDFEDSNTWSGDLPEGYLFLTTKLREAKTYGQYVIPCELKWYDNITFNVNANNPSQIFDKDYGIDLFKNDKYYGFWEKFEDSEKRVLIIKGTDRSTVITYIENVIPRNDLAVQFYNMGGKNKTKDYNQKT